MSSKKEILRKIKSKTTIFFHSDVPEELKNDRDIIIAERKAGIRRIYRIGYDVIKNNFFVEELLLHFDHYDKFEWYLENHNYNVFDEFYDYLDGEIYDYACYYQLDVSRITKPIDADRFWKKTALIEETVDDYTSNPTSRELSEYREREKVKRLVKKWIEKFRDCTTVEELDKTLKAYDKSALFVKHRIYNDIYMWSFAFPDSVDKQNAKIIIQAASLGITHKDYTYRLCFVYGPQFVLDNYNPTAWTKQGNAKKIRELKKFIETVNINDPELHHWKVSFDLKTHYYLLENKERVKYYYATFDEVVRALNYDLSGVDISKDFMLNYDFSSCKMDENTILPVQYYDNLRYEIVKEYSRGKFRVKQAWYNDCGKCVREHVNSFDYFFDFVKFLKGDLSGADLSLCDGLNNLSDVSNINLSGAKLQTSFCETHGIEYEQCELDFTKIQSFSETEHYEEETAIVLQSDDRVMLPDEDEVGFLQQLLSGEYWISYISDIHIMHKLQQSNVKSKADVYSVVQKIANTIATETSNVLLIGGDVSSDFSIFELFVSLLRHELDSLKKKPLVLFILGNHELWPFHGKKFKEIVLLYWDKLKEYGMYLVNNYIFYKDINEKWHILSTRQIIDNTTAYINSCLKKARLIIFGGVGFSGCNKTFNANSGIYKNVITREQEIEESKGFKALYDKVLEALPSRNTIIFTHMPMDCWSEEVNYKKGVIYLSGHTHRNVFYDDGETRIYADNQIGYKNNVYHLKNIYFNKIIDYFDNYQDGIYKITRDDYITFYRARNNSIEFNRPVKEIYMFKKQGYYMFSCITMAGSYAILQGGNIRQLPDNDIQYYYDHMGEMIGTIKNPLDKYSEFQNKIADEVQAFGGWGSIHGCIIDIDFNNHIYVNPIDLKITPYWAESMVYKVVYPSVPELLHKRCPELYTEYCKQIEGSKAKHEMIINKAVTECVLRPQVYLDTDIYKASRKVKNMQNIYDNILTVWHSTREKQYKMLSTGLDTVKNTDVAYDNTPKPVIQMDYSGTKVIQEFASINQASRQTGVPAKSIRKNIRGEQKRACGYVWKMKNVEEQT
ncbi:MAG: hypothetical protein K6F92_06215 [Lachnospiraceae bacterium]|nr:hypothetical protein [Lachnospiraceae bacterium]